MPKTIIVVACCLFIGLSVSYAEESILCPSDKSFETPKQMYSYTVQITSNPRDDLGHPCRLTVKTAAGRPILTAKEMGIGLMAGSAGVDFDGDGKPDLLFEAWTGGAHCCFRYWLITSGTEPRIWEFFDYDPFVIENQGNNHAAKIRAWDGAFDYFESSFAASPSPQIVFSLAGGAVNVVTGNDANVCSAKLPSQLDAEAIQHFRSSAKCVSTGCSGRDRSG
jgi:hypothetical protein